MPFIPGKFALPPKEDPEKFRRVLGAAYTAWVGSAGRRIPDANDVQEIVPNITRKVIGRIMETPEFIDAIQKRGVPWDKEAGLTTRQMLALSIMTNPTDKRNPAAKLKTVGVSYAEYRAWQRDPAFKARLEGIVSNMVKDHIADMEVALTNKAINGDLGAIKFVYEMTGKYDPASKEVIQLRALVTALLEILSKHLSTQPELMIAVATDIQQLMPRAISGEVISK